MRLIWVLDAGFPRPLCNRAGLRQIRDGTSALRTCSTPIAGVVGEYDGELHLEPSQRWLDRGREEAFRRVGLEYFTMMRGDSTNREVMARRMDETRRRALFRSEPTRDWTLDLPHWWIPTMTVDQRRNLDPAQRERLLRLRRRTRWSQGIVRDVWVAPELENQPKRLGLSARSRRWRS